MPNTDVYRGRALGNTGNARRNSYRGIRQEALCDPTYANNVADLTWHGANFANPVYTNSYCTSNGFCPLLNNTWVRKRLPGGAFILIFH